ncbi:hypothetical protein ACFQL1_15935 [Halomicroarcula sp. GCM10025709]|uniref:hypothetical protein n=1 Tax=Haloarcula TaxID=2237 RepID=UPI0024C300A4|nr:hypothetical protein [Halomicroarcula sp. YJ-61-S]
MATVDSAAISGRWRIEEHDMDAVRDEHPTWDTLADWHKLAILRRREPEEAEETTNTTTKSLDQYRVDDLDPTQSPTALTASHIALGTDDTSPVATNTSLNSEEYRESVDAHTDNGDNLKCETLIGSGEANGFEYKEAGLVTASSGGTLLNHSLIKPRVKTSNKSLTVTAILQFRPA